MPVRSKDQAVWLRLHRPDLLKKWQEESPVDLADLPEKLKAAVKRKPRKKK